MEGSGGKPDGVVGTARLPADRVRDALSVRYRVERELGHGGMAVVYLAEDLKHHRKVAIKVLRPELAAALGSERFLREIDIAANLTHPNILPLHDSGEADGLLYYVMPYVKGKSLRERLNLETQLPIEDALRITCEVADALSHAHSLGIVHRDIKPENILFEAEHAVVADFGIARAMKKAGAEALSETGFAIGTPAYMSPEQASAEKVDVRSDIYSLGCVVYEMLGGEPPYTGPSAQAIIARKLHEPVRPLHNLRETVPSNLEKALEKALARTPADRFKTALEFAEALKVSWAAPSQGRRFGAGVLRTTKRRALAAAAVLLAAVVSGVFAVRTLQSRQPSWTGRPESVVVVPFHTSTSSEQERVLADELADEITRELSAWESIRTVSSMALSGPMFDLGLPGPTLDDWRAGVELSRQVSAQALLAVTVEVRGDSAFAEGALFDVQTERAVGQPLQARARLGDVAMLVAPMASGVLGLGGVAAAPEDLRRRSAFPDAIFADAGGMKHLEQWRLSEAEEGFRRAVAIDSGCGVAMNHLAQTLYWRAADDRRFLEQVGPEISRWSTKAMAHSAGLSLKDSLHIRGFYAFQRGDYDEARTTYGTLLSADTTDVYAWLMLGSVEFQDPWLVADTSGELRPRSDMNVATSAFMETLRLQPSFDLGYGHLFDIYGEVEAALIPGCGGFEIPRAQVLPVWELTTPYQLIPFCPVVTEEGPIVWVDTGSLESIDPAVMKEGARRLFEQSLALMKRWAHYAPDQARPKEMLVQALLTRRRHMGMAAPERLQALTREARDYASQALALRPDTMTNELIRLAGLYLGAGDLDSALALVQSALAQDDGMVGISPVAANVFLAAGQPSRAIDIAANRGHRWYVPDSITDELIPYDGAERVVTRIRVLGATGVSGERIEEEFRRLDDAFDESMLSVRQRQILYDNATPHVMLGLVQNQAELITWSGSFPKLSPLWDALLASERDPTAARIHLDGSLGYDFPGLRPATEYYLEAIVASRLGDDSLAARLFSAIDSLPLRVAYFDPSWGLRGLSVLLRAEAYENLADTGQALQNYERFLAEWVDAEAQAELLVDQARENISRLDR